jgi:hypothetical protein
MTDEQARRAIGELLLRAFAAQPATPPEMAMLIAKLDGSSPQPPRPEKVTRCD